MSLMKRIEPTGRWGIGSAGFGDRVAFKGGWGPEPSGGYVVRQSGIVHSSSRRPAAVSIVAYAAPDNGTFMRGVEMVNAAARSLATSLGSGLDSGVSLGRSVGGDLGEAAIRGFGSTGLRF